MQLIVFMLLCLATMIVFLAWFDYLFMSITSDPGTSRKRKIWTILLFLLWIVYFNLERLI